MAFAVCRALFYEIYKYYLSQSSEQPCEFRYYYYLYFTIKEVESASILRQLLKVT